MEGFLLFDFGKELFLPYLSPNLSEEVEIWCVNLVETTFTFLIFRLFRLIPFPYSSKNMTFWTFFFCILILAFAQLPSKLNQKVEILEVPSGYLIITSPYMKWEFFVA